MKTQYHYSQVSVNRGRELIRRYGLYAANRFLKNLGLVAETVCEYLAVIPRKG